MGKAVNKTASWAYYDEAACAELSSWQEDFPINTNQFSVRLVTARTLGLDMTGTDETANA